MGLKNALIHFIVIGALAVGGAFNLWVISECDFLRSNTNGYVGVFRYSLDFATAGFDSTGGQCIQYTSKEVDGYLRTAQVCSVMAACFGFSLVFLILIEQFCCNIPWSGLIATIGYIGAQVSQCHIVLSH